ncbi:hypothetical protein MPTK1_8g11570 [Marchantia polymorpha subsp. ruderalis]|uniref:Uncharacterized protein n=1 Tax=Marchantia polymorpha TaxID=3197 RepID=A0A2R6XMF2_MARPO|nr:hypothetical protein MARPO_0008s0059 [Marchantia polymorpha]BBN19544.1 hypothetical protein Mp_8g11570 [Marchantia polymorpha subsp. ruderalis]|eukprot:PTQ47280.1 hypothetical protein MARPO_0008s0059 [Marchantia polymorpha]
MGRSVALSRLSLLNVLGRRNVYFSSSLIQSCPGSSEPYLEQASHFSSVASDSSPSPSTSGPASIEKTALGSAAAARREYEKQTALLRKKYAAELAEKKKREQKDEEIVRARISELKADRLQLKKEKAAARAIEVEEENRILQAHLKEQRATNVTARNKLEARQGLIRHKRMVAIRRQSSMWIEEKDLERRILEAMSNPFHLRGYLQGAERLDRDESYYETEDV